MSDVAATGAPYAGFGTKGYRAYVLFALLLVYTFNFIDRVVITILQEPIKHEFQLTDFQLGLMGGPTFAILYTLLGIPIARLAERRNRLTILSVSVALWSLMTAFCGMANSFATLLLARIGVGVGEAGGTPPSQSVISDYFPPETRATAISIYSTGVTLGSMLAAFGGGYIAQHLGWREAFLVLGFLGLGVAVLVKLTVKEPPRSTNEEAPSFGKAFAILAKKPTFWWVALGTAAGSFVGYGVGNYYVSFFIRIHGVSLLRASQLTGLLIGVFGTLGVFAAGFLADKVVKRYPNALAWLPAVGFLITMPMAVIGFRLDSLPLAVTVLGIGLVPQYFYLGAQYAITQGVVHPKMRATAVAVLLFVVNMLGYGLGPPVVGAISDHFANANLAASGLSVEACKAAASAQAAVCAAGIAAGLRTAMQIGALVFLVGSGCFLMAWRTMQKDWHR